MSPKTLYPPQIVVRWNEDRSSSYMSVHATTQEAMDDSVPGEPKRLAVYTLTETMTATTQVSVGKIRRAKKP